ncbi:MAG TPA: GDSL-type esterase/lipase family protein [Candidatus Saccharimonadales bacterium]|nr:GDSL-type esterase/lipase family protein [Candidatus Saccharimonadales bacterium]
MANILIFGDSIAYGCWDEKGGWAQRLKHTVDQKNIVAGFTNDHFVYPLGIPGDTTHTLLQRFKQETDARFVPHEASLFIFAIGINDSLFNNKTNSCIIPLWKFKNNLQTLIHAAKRYTKQSVFIGLTPVDEAKVDPMSWLPECSYRNDFIKEYDAALQEVCVQENTSFVPVFEEWKKVDYRRLLLDGVHPNGEGHTILFEEIKKNIHLSL